MFQQYVSILIFRHDHTARIVSILNDIAERRLRYRQDRVWARGPQALSEFCDPPTGSWFLHLQVIVANHESPILFASHVARRRINENFPIVHPIEKMLIGHRALVVVRMLSATILRHERDHLMTLGDEISSANQNTTSSEDSFSQSENE